MVTELGRREPRSKRGKSTTLSLLFRVCIIVLIMDQSDYFMEASSYSQVSSRYCITISDLHLKSRVSRMNMVPLELIKEAQLSLKSTSVIRSPLIPLNATIEGKKVSSGSSKTASAEASAYT